MNKTKWCTMPDCTDVAMGWNRWCAFHIEEAAREIERMRYTIDALKASVREERKSA